VDFDGKLFSGGGLFTCPECFRLQQFSQKQAEARSRDEEVERRLYEAQLQEDSGHVRAEGRTKIRSKVRTAITYLNAGLFDDAVRSAAEVAELADEDDVEARIDVSSIYIYTAAQANKPRLAQGYVDSFQEEVVDFLFNDFFGITPVREDLIEIPEHWKDALECLPQRGASRDHVSEVKKSVVALVQARHTKSPPQDRSDANSPQNKGESSSELGPMMRAAAVSAAHASVLSARLWNGIRLGLTFGTSSSLFLAGIYFFKGPMAGGVGLSEMVVFGMTAGMIIGILAKLRS
jgi:hypothetical protein